MFFFKFYCNSMPLHIFESNTNQLESFNFVWLKLLYIYIYIYSSFLHSQTRAIPEASSITRALSGARCTGIMNKDRYQSTSARRALALLNSPLGDHIRTSKCTCTSLVTSVNYTVGRFQKPQANQRPVPRITEQNGTEHIVIGISILSSSVSTSKFKKKHTFIRNREISHVLVWICFPKLNSGSKLNSFLSIK